MNQAIEIHTHLYSKNRTEQKRVLDYYHPQATFDDPLVSVRGRDAILYQFMFVSWFPAVESDRISVTQTEATSFQVVFIESDVIFGIIPSWIELKLRLYTKLIFHQDQVVAHEDVWSMSHLLDNTFGFFYRFLKSWNGILSTVLVKQVNQLTNKSE